MAQILLDTTYFIDLRRGDPGARQLWSEIAGDRVTAAFSSVTAYELWLNKSLTRRDELFYEAMFSVLEEAPLSSLAALWTARSLRALPRRIRDRRLRDAFIAYSAIERGEAICTRNVRDFSRHHSNVQTY
jgi:predicted nucleic acid-binding protein